MTPELLRNLADSIEDLRCSIILDGQAERRSRFKSDGYKHHDGHMTPMAEQHLLIAFSHIEALKAHLKLAAACLEKRE
jgi:hypothetical protein